MESQNVNLNTQLGAILQCILTTYNNTLIQQLALMAAMTQAAWFTLRTLVYCTQGPIIRCLGNLSHGSAQRPLETGTREQGGVYQGVSPSRHPQNNKGL